MENLPLSYIELSRDNLIYNLKALKSITNNTKIVGVIKGNAYGHGQNEITKIIEPFVDYFQVNSFLELRLLRRISKKDTFVLGYIQKEDLRKTMELGSILSIFSIEKMDEINELARKLKIKQKVHISMDAYLGREGFLKDELIQLLEKMKDYKNIKIDGIYAHFANIEDTNNFTHAKKQIKKFKESIKIANQYGLKSLKTHISATSGLLVYEKNKDINSIVRLGIGIYGLWPSEHIKYLYKNKLKLKPVLSWKTKVAQVKLIPAGHTIGYGLTYMTYEPTKIAVIPVGYADGYDRKLSNNGKVIIKGKFCDILGRIAMNMFVVNVNHIKDLSKDEEVILIGEQGVEKITIEDIAKKIDSINYEVVTRLNPLIPRIIK